jgi:hypothetical protein
VAPLLNLAYQRHGQIAHITQISGRRVCEVRPGTAGQGLEELLGRKVDLVPKDGLHWVIRDRAIEDSEILYAA